MMKLDFPAGLFLVQASAKSSYQPGQFGTLLSIEWAEGTFWFTFDWPIAGQERVKLQDVGDIAMIPISHALGLYQKALEPTKATTYETMRAEYNDILSTLKIFRGYSEDLETRLHALGDQINEVVSNGNS